MRWKVFSELSRKLRVTCIGDGAAALGLGAGGGEAQQGAADADRIDPAVLEEACILGREEGVDHQGRDVVVGHRTAALDTELGDQAAVAAEDPQRLLELDLTQTLHTRQLRGMDRHEDTRPEQTQCKQLQRRAQDAEKSEKPTEHGATAP